MFGKGAPGTKRLCALYALNAAALGLWSVNFPSVLKAHGLESLVPYTFACNATAALLSPLAVGALADQRMAPERVLRLLGLGTMFFLGLLFFGIQQHWGPGWVWALAQIHALWSVPTFGLTTSLVMSRLSKPKEQFGPVRIWATLGWMGACLMVSWVLHADTSVTSGYAACVVWAITVGMTFALPYKERLHLPKPRRTVKEIMGLDALPLLRHPDHIVVFVSAGLLNMALAAFYPFTVLHLADHGIQQVTAAMSLGQVTEIIAMLALSSIITRIRLKWIFLAGIAFGVLRYALFALDNVPALLLGIFLHGFCFTLFFVTAQIYLEQRIPGEMRARAQALLTLMMGGFGNLFGYLGTGWWRKYCQSTSPDGALTTTAWSTFWIGMTLLTLGVFVFFALAYQGRKRGVGTDEGESHYGGHEKM
ncbi:MFS transporter [Verrucomicrobium sp. BvORR034]|uniref:MFS transporter n=1 Tax=Verrucomicrobium sp. BvORR034 TaxID=1396418 RepID=UPI000678442F|nr:MFS transporter [Verrucomicrobium sp. BvORR034]